MTTDQTKRRALQLAKLREIYGTTGRREPALLFIRLSPVSLRNALMAEFEHMEMMADNAQSYPNRS